MIIKKKRIRSLKNNFPSYKEGQKFFIGVEGIEKFIDTLKHIGLRSIQPGNSILPSPVGPISQYNAEGKSIINKHLPKETVYYQKEWHWKQWAGRGRTVDMEKIVDVPRERFQRTLLPPPSVELVVSEKQGNSYKIITPILSYSRTEEKNIIHTINLFLEIFGECSIYDKNLNSISASKIKKLNWRVLPKGVRPWENINKELKPIIKKSKGNGGVIENRFKVINEHNPDFHAVGEAGFNGYVIMGFKSKNLYLLESAFYGNATYVLEKDWREISKMTKAQILNQNLQKDRIIHREGWEKKIADLF